MIWYKARSISISEVEVIKETKSQVVIKNKVSGRISRSAKISQYDSYFKTFKEAYDHILSNLDARLSSAVDELDNEQLSKSVFFEKYGKPCSLDI